MDRKMKSHHGASSMYHVDYHRQPQDRPISLFRRKRETLIQFQDDEACINLSLQQPNDDKSTTKSFGKINPAMSVPHLWETNSEIKCFGKIDEKIQTSSPSFTRGMCNSPDKYEHGKRIPTPFITPRVISDRRVYLNYDRSSNNNSRSGLVPSSPSFDASWVSPSKTRQRACSLSSYRSQPSLACTDCTDSYTPVSIITNEEYYDTSSKVCQQQTYPPHATTTPNDTIAPTCQYFFTPPQSTDSNNLSHYSFSLPTNDQHPTITSHIAYPPYERHRCQAPISQCGPTPYHSVINTRVKNQQMSPHQSSSTFKIVNSNHTSSVQNFYCQPTTPHQSSMPPKYEHIPIIGGTYDHINFPPLPAVVSSSTSTSCSGSPEDAESLSLSPTLIPQSFKNDMHRQKKVKTELCKYFLNGSVSMCPFGSKCNYAHGEKELKYSTLHEMKSAGLVENIHTYRTHPCFSWVSVGACPFGLRCNGIHDPRIESPWPSWLPHSDTPVNNLKTDLNVDKSYHTHLTALHQLNPLVNNLIWHHRPSLVSNCNGRKNEIKVKKHGSISPSMAMNGSDDWADTYALVCNMTSLKGRGDRTPMTRKLQKGSVSVNLHHIAVSELQRVSIAVLMSKNTDEGIEGLPFASHREYIYKPMSLVYNELCMVLQERYFQLLSPDLWNDAADEKCGSIGGPDKVDTILQYIVKEVSREKYALAARKRSCRDIIIVREIAFGSLGEEAAKTSIWYDIPDDAIKFCSVQEIKRFKRERQRNISKQPQNRISNFPDRNEKRDTESISTPYPGSDKTTRSLFFNHPHRPFFHMQPVSGNAVLHDLIHSFLCHRIWVLALRLLTKTKQISECIRMQRDSKKCLKQMFINIVDDTNVWRWPVSAGRKTINERTLVPMCSTKYNPSSRSRVLCPLWDGLCKSLAKNEPFTKKNITEKNPKRRYDIFCKLADGQCIIPKEYPLPSLKKTRNQKGNHNTMYWKSILLEPDAQHLDTDWQLIAEYYQDRIKRLNHGNITPNDKNDIL